MNTIKTEVVMKLNQSIQHIKIIESLIHITMSDLTNPNGSVSEEHTMNFYRALVCLLKESSRNLEDVVDNLTLK